MQARDCVDAVRPEARNLRELEEFCERVASELGLEREGARGASMVAAFLGRLRRLPLVWFQFAPVARCRDAFARCTSPWAGDMLFAQLPCGPGAEARGPAPKTLRELSATLRASAGKYLCVVEGPLPSAAPALASVAETALQVCSHARAVLTVGAGALSAGVVDALGTPAIRLGGAPPSAVAFAAALFTHFAAQAAQAAAAEHDSARPC
jgi:Ni,Fe-hydrogenase I small subunit